MKEYTLKFKLEENCVLSDINLDNLVDNLWIREMIVENRKTYVLGNLPFYLENDKKYSSMKDVIKFLKSKDVGLSTEFLPLIKMESFELVDDIYVVVTFHLSEFLASHYKIEGIELDKNKLLDSVGILGNHPFTSMITLGNLTESTTLYHPQLSYVINELNLLTDNSIRGFYSDTKKNSVMFNLVKFIENKQKESVRKTVEVNLLTNDLYLVGDKLSVVDNRLAYTSSLKEDSPKFIESTTTTLSEENTYEVLSKYMFQGKEYLLLKVI